MRPNCTPKFGDRVIGTSFDDVRDGAVRVAGDDRLQRAARQLAHEAKDLAAVVARGEIMRIRDLRSTSRPRASRARRAPRRARATRAASRATVAASGVVASPSTCAASVCRKPLSVIMPIRPTRTPAASTIADGTTFGQRTGLPARRVDDVGREEREAGARGGGLERALQVARLGARRSPAAATPRRASRGSAEP